jgi:hypothetical protein
MFQVVTNSFAKILLIDVKKKNFLCSCELFNRVGINIFFLFFTRVKENTEELLNGLKPSFAAISYVLMG